MPLCSKCKKFFPPQFVKKLSGNDYLCIFCERGVNEIKYGPLKSKTATRDQIVKEYQKFVKRIREDSNILKRTVKGENNDTIIAP